MQLQISAFLIFIPLQIIWLPLSLIGIGLVGYRQLVISKRLGVSQTAVEIINGRWAMDVFGLRDDAAARELARAIPNNSVYGLWLTLFPIWVISKLLRVQFLYPTIVVPEDAKLINLVPSRTIEFDTLIRANIHSSEQLVILGAGLDTRAYGEFKERNINIYELDEHDNQAHKLASLAGANIDSSHVRFVPVDFKNDEWIKALLTTDYDPKKKTIFLWEGVTLYLPEPVVCETLAILKNITPAGSVILTDIYSQHFVDLTKSKTIAWSLEITGEAINFGLDFSTDAENILNNFTEANEVSLGHHQFLGSKNKHGPFVVIAELIL